MNFLSLCLVGGKLSSHYYNPGEDTPLFFRLGEWGHNIKYQPSNEPYYIIAQVGHGNFWRQDTSPEAQTLIDRLTKDVQSKHAILVILKYDSFGVADPINTVGWINHCADFLVFLLVILSMRMQDTILKKVCVHAE